MSVISDNNTRLRRYIKNMIQAERFGEPYATLIIEVFVREQHILELTPEEFVEDLMNFKNTTYRFRYDKMQNPNWLAYQSSEEHEIVFNVDYWNNLIQNCSPQIYAQKFFETFSHECLHSMQTTWVNGRAYNRAGGYNSQVKNRAHAIYEIGTQAIASKMSYDRSHYDFNNNVILSGDGYADEIFAIPLIASTFGISEKDVIKYSVRNRDDFIRILDKEIGDLNKTNELVNRIEDQLELMHSISYPDDNQTNFKKMSDKEKKKAKTDAILKLVDICQEAFIVRIKNTPIDFNKEIAIKYKYNQKKMLDTLRQEFQLYQRGFDDDYETLFNVATEYSGNAKYIKEAVNIFNQIGKCKTGKYMSISPYLVQAVKVGDFAYCSNFGMELVAYNDNYEYTQMLLDRAGDFKEKQAHEDYNDFRSWDNSIIYDALIYKRNDISYNESEAFHWDGKPLYDEQGLYKLDILKKVILGNKNKYGVESRNVIFEYLTAPQENLDEILTKFTRTNGVRDNFKREFGRKEDKEFLARVIADKYIESIFDTTANTGRQLVEQDDIKMQQLFMPTLKKYGKNQLIFAISNALLGDYYEGFSTEQTRTEIAIIGKRTLYDIVSKPLMQELLNQRDENKSKRNAIQKSFSATEEKYPGTISARISKFIRDYKATGARNFNIFTSYGRNELISNFSDSESMEDFIGIICDDFSREVDSNQKGLYDSNIQVQILNKMSSDYGKDDFREKMIKFILYGDTSTFANIDEINYLNTASIDSLINVLSIPCIERAKAIKSVNDLNNQQYVVNSSELQEVAQNRKYSLLDKLTGALSRIRRKEKDQEVSNDIRSGD